MSWIFGAFGNIDDKIKNKLEKIIKGQSKFQSNSNTIFQLKGKNFWISAGGNSQTLFFGDIPFSNTEFQQKNDHYGEQSQVCHWVSAGLGILDVNGSYRLMKEKDWINFFKNYQDNFVEINGHFCSTIFNDNEIRIYTDQLGTRDIFFIQTDDHLIFSTKLEFLTKYLGQFEFDFKEMGSLWLLESQINTGSFIKNIKRLTSSSKISAKFIKRFEIYYEEKLWTPQKYFDINEEDLYQKLLELVSLPLNENLKILLALSGGMDSRLLLSVLQDVFDSKNIFEYYNDSLFDTFSFGLPNDLDIEIPSEMSKEIGFKHQVFFEDFKTNDKTISDLTNFIINTKLTFPASEYLLKRNYNYLINQNFIILDGCWGEITRRSLFKRLITFARNDILNRNTNVFFDYMQYHHSDIFNEEINRAFKEGALEHLEKCLSQMPDFENFSLDSWMDLLAIRTKQPNLVGIEQTRIDNLVMSFSPFVQPDFFNLIFATNPKIKRNGSLLKKVFKKNKRRLDKYPLNASGIKIPFSYSSLSISIKKKIFSYLPHKTISYRSLLLNELNEFIEDLINSLTFVNFEFYDKKKINKIFLDFKRGIPKAEREMDWLLAFELFRKGLIDE